MYKYNSNTSNWEHNYEDGSQAIIGYNEEAYSWALTYVTSEASTVVMQTKSTDKDAPYRSGIVWVFCGKEGFVPQEPTKVFDSGVEEDTDPED